MHFITEILKPFGTISEQAKGLFDVTPKNWTVS